MKRVSSSVFSRRSALSAQNCPQPSLKIVQRQMQGWFRSSRTVASIAFRKFSRAAGSRFSRESLRDMQSRVRQVFSSAKLYVPSDADDGTKLGQMYSFLMERFDYTVQTSITPTYSLLLHGVGDSRAFAQVYAAMCRQIGIEAMTVSGTRNGESRFWNIVRKGDAYCHVDLLECARLGYYFESDDDQMGNYVWDYSAYPACGEGQTVQPRTETESTEAPEE